MSALRWKALVILFFFSASVGWLSHNLALVSVGLFEK
jgi:hypothetical protein